MATPEIVYGGNHDMPDDLFPFSYSDKIMSFCNTKLFQYFPQKIITDFKVMSYIVRDCDKFATMLPYYRDTKVIERH